MKVLVALAFLLWIGADALYNSPDHLLGHHNPQHKLTGIPWITGQTHLYKLIVNMTAGVPGMTSQVAKSVIQMDVLIRSKSEREYLLQAKNVFVSRPTSSVSSPDIDMPMTPNRELETELQKPIKFYYEDGKVTKYTLGDTESLQSRSIKRGILRHFEMKIDRSALEPPRGEDNPELYPIVYNTTEFNEMGPYNVYYGITVSPYPWFPYENNVYNISKTVDYEPYHYPSFHEHDNFFIQGCPSLCQLDSDSIHNKYCAGCPGEYEPNKTPLKASFVVHHNYRLLRENMVLEDINVEESSVANMYDQDIVVDIQSDYELKGIVNFDVKDPQEQQTEYTVLNTIPTIDDLKIIEVKSLDDISKEYQWIYGIFGNIRAFDLVSLAETVLEKVTTSVISGNIESTRGQEVAQDVAQLQDTLSLLTKVHLQTLWSKIVDVKSLRNAGEKQKIMRQIFLDVIPLCGTDESIAFIKYLIEEKKLLTWEAKEVLEALPPNIIEADENNIRDLWSLLELPHVTRYHLLHSAAHLTLARVIREACVVPMFTPDDKDVKDELYKSPQLREQWWEYQPKQSRYTSWPNRDEDEEDGDYDKIPVVSKYSKIKQNRPRTEEVPLCRTGTVQKFLEEMRTKLKSANKIQEKIVYITAIANLGYNESLEILKPYIYGVADDIIDYEDGDVDYIKSVTLYALHEIAPRFPDETLAIAALVYFNRTEVPRVRTAAFSVLIRCEPPLAVLQHVVQDTWDEPSNEVGSYVYSTLEYYGNASTPCMKLTADRIKLVISQAKKYDIGWQYSKSIIKTFFDDIRNFGIEKQFAVVYSNESFVPSYIFSSLKYNIQSLKDIFLMVSANVQGAKLENFFTFIDQELVKLKIPNDIPSSTENQIFGNLNILPRLPKSLRITIYKKFFYTTSLIYLDAESFRNTFVTLQEYIREYFGGGRDTINGHFVKTFIPSSVHAITYSTIGVPVDFRMKHPLVISVKVESRPKPRSNGFSLSYYIRPCVYYATYHKKIIMNVIDRRAYGVYQEEKYTFTLPPLEVSFAFNLDANAVEATYKLFEVPKRIFRYHSEAGTFETELNVRKIYSSEVQKKTFETIPVLFKRERVISGFGLPPVYVVHHTEDIQDQYIDLPRNLEDIVQLITEAVRNPGWRRKDINATIVSRPSSTVNQVTFLISYNRTLHMKTPERSSSLHQSEHSEAKSIWLWSSIKANDDENPSDEDESTVLNKIWQKRGSNREDDEISPGQATEIHEALSTKLSKVAHEFSVKVETGPSKNTAELRVEYNCTFDRMAHSFKTYGEVYTAEKRTPYKICLNYLMLFTKSPTEFSYDIRKYTEQSAPFLFAASFGDDCKSLDQSDVIARGAFYKIPSERLFDRDEFSERPDTTAFYPETHEECVKDIRDGKAQSPACVAAVMEESHLNKFNVRIVTREELPPALLNITYKLDRAMKYYYFANADINRVNVQNPPKTFRMSMKYIEKLTDKPVVEVFIQKPDENVMYRRADPEYLLPLSSVFTLPDSYILRATNNTYLPFCGLMEKHINTYDNKVYPLPRDTCTYLLSTHCTEKKKFAVLAKRISASDDVKEITLHLAEQKVVLKPGGSRDTYTVVHNDRSIELTAAKPVLLDAETLLYVYLVPAYGHRVNYVLYLHVDNGGIKIMYDGKNTKIQVHPFYKGQLCGLCSEYDGEVTREYRGPNHCWYLDEEDFAHSSIVNSDSCGVSTEPKKPALCPSGFSQGPSYPTPTPDYPGYPYNPYDDDTDADDYRRGTTRDNEPKLRTLTLQRRDFVCFSTQPVPVCDEGSMPEEEYLVSADYHCLPKYDATTRRLLNDSKTRVLTELSNKKVDFTDKVSAAKSCTSY